MKNSATSSIVLGRSRVFFGAALYIAGSHVMLGVNSGRSLSGRRLYVSPSKSPPPKQDCKGRSPGCNLHQQKFRIMHDMGLASDAKNDRVHQPFLSKARTFRWATYSGDDLDLESIFVIILYYIIANDARYRHHPDEWSATLKSVADRPSKQWFPSLGP